jgi:uncharacterized protein YdgA (DUF945 family)
LLVLAVLVLVSPGIVGHLAERSLDEGLDWAATRTEEVAVTSRGFERGWFSSAGRHRIEITDEELRELLLAYTGGPGVPALIIETRLDHGLIPVASLGRDDGSLAPGLGRAVSTLALETADQSSIPLPGKIISHVGLAGTLTSNYVLSPGSFSEGGTTASWGEVDVSLAASPGDGAIRFDGSIESISLDSMHEHLRIADIRFSGDQRPSPFGFRVGPLELSVASIGLDDRNENMFGPVSWESVSTLDDDRVNLQTRFGIAGGFLDGIGRVDIELEARLEGADGRSAGRLQDHLGRLNVAANPDPLMWEAEHAARQLLARGVALHIDVARIATPGGDVVAELHLVVDESDPASSAWTSVLLATDASTAIRVPAGLVDSLAAIDPEIGAAVGMGLLRKDGDNYEMHATFKNGALTVNGAPMPLPIPGLR